MNNSIRLSVLQNALNIDLKPTGVAIAIATKEKTSSYVAIRKLCSSYVEQHIVKKNEK